MIHRKFPILLTLLFATQVLAGPPKPVPYKRVPDPADDAERHIVVKADDRGPVWLLTGFLHGWEPGITYEHLARVKPKHMRMGVWPFWFPRTLAGGGKKTWGDYRDSPKLLGNYLDTMLRLRETGTTWQLNLHFKGRYYAWLSFVNDANEEQLKDYYDHIYTLVKYCRNMGLPVDYWEVTNEPAEPHHTEENPGGYFKHSWQDFLAYWDTNYNAVRAAYPEAKIVGPSYGGTTVEAIDRFLAHCKEKGQKLDVLSWHINAGGKGPNGHYWDEVDSVHRQIEAVRKLVETKYPMVGVEEYHIDEWGYYLPYTGMGVQIAYFHYMDLAGVDRVAKTGPPYMMSATRISPDTPRAAYWAWVDYAKQDGGLRLVTETNDRNFVAVASRHDDEKIVRAVVGRAKRHSMADPAEDAPAWKFGDQPPAKPPVAAKIDFEGIPLSGKAELTILRLPPGSGPLYEDELEALTTKTVMDVTDGKLTVELADVVEDNAFSIRIAPLGTWATEAKASAEQEEQKRASQGIGEGKLLPHVLFKEGFEQGFTERETILGKRGWTHAKNETSALKVFTGAKTAHSGEWYAQFTENYWATNNCFHAIPEQRGGVIEVTAWYRFPGYEGNRNGKGYGATMIGLCETPDRSDNKNFASFKFGTHEQNGYSVVIFNNDGARRINWTDASGLRSDVRGKWYQVSLVLDMEARRVTARHRPSAKDPWKVFHTETFRRMGWTPRYVLISAYNQAPDWRFCVDDVEVRSSLKN